LIIPAEELIVHIRQQEEDQKELKITDDLNITLYLKLEVFSLDIPIQTPIGAGKIDNLPFSVLLH
jgi:hypothetical protein